MPHVRRLIEIGKDELDEAGGKALALARLLRAGFPVPVGVVIPTSAFAAGVDLNALVGELAEALRESGVDRLAVRSSAVGEDSHHASWAGQLETILNVPVADAWTAVERCRASMARATLRTYAGAIGIDPWRSGIAVLLQQMLRSDSAGVVFTANPITGDLNEFVIEAAFGLGTAVVEGLVNPDRWVVDRNSETIVTRQIGPKRYRVDPSADGTASVAVETDRAVQPTLTDAQVHELARLALEVEKVFGGVSQDIEWALAGGQFYLLQARPITAGLQSQVRDAVSPSRTIPSSVPPVLSGLGVSRGVASGPVRVVASADDRALVQAGDIVIAAAMTPELVDALAKAAAVVTVTGGLTSHAAVVAREFGIPCVVAADDALTKLCAGQVITVDGGRGEVFQGAIAVAAAPPTPTLEFPLLRSSGNDIDDFVASFTRAASNVTEMWPLTPSQLFPYFQVPQALDMRERLRAARAAGQPLATLAPYFVGPKRVRNFMVDIALMGMKVARRKVDDTLTIADQVEMFELMAEILHALSPDDPFCLRGRNLVLREPEAEHRLSRTEWRPVDDAVRRALARLTVSLFNYVWSLYFDYFSGAGMEAHGPYKAPTFGQDTSVVIKDYYDLQPEVWRDQNLPALGTLCLAQMYEGVVPIFNFGSRVINQDELTPRCIQYHLSLDGRTISAVEDIDRISDAVQAASKRQISVVNGLSPVDKVRKGAELSYYSLSTFYSHVGTDWYSEATRAVDPAIERSGAHFVEVAAERDRGRDFKRQLVDPRTDVAPV